MADIVYDYSHAPTIKRFSESRKFIRGLMGPFGSGKSSGCVIELVKLASRQHVVRGKRRARFAVIRNTYKQLEDTTIKTFLEWLPDLSFGRYYRSDHNYIIDKLEPDLEIEVMFRALDRPEHVANLLSLELTAAWVNEAREVPLAIIRALQGRVGRYPAMKDGGAVDPGIIMDTNPPDDESWWYEMFEEDPSDSVALFRQPSGRSPEAENLPYLLPTYYANLMAGADAEFIKVYVDGQYGFVKEGKPIYPDYNDAIHCAAAEPIPGLPIKRGWDFGLTPACVFTQITPNGQWLIFDELVSEDIGIEKFADVVLLHTAQKYSGFKDFEDVGDPAGDSKSETDEKTCFQILRGKGILVGAEGLTQDLTIRLESVRKPLNMLHQGKPQLVLHPRCKVLRKGFQGRYQYRRLKIAGTAERYQDQPDKNEYSHPHDALQYVAVRVFGDAVKAKTKQKFRKIVYDKRGIV